MPSFETPRSPEAARHFQQLSREVDTLRSALAKTRGPYEAANLFLFVYDDIMARCPKHAKGDIMESLLQTAREAGLTDPSWPMRMGARTWQKLATLP